MDVPQRFLIGGWYAWLRAVVLVGVSAAGLWSLLATVREGATFLVAAWLAGLIFVWWFVLTSAWRVTVSDGVVEFRGVFRTQTLRMSDLRVIRPVMLGHAIEFRSANGSARVLSEVRHLDEFIALVRSSNQRVVQLP